MHKLIDAAVFAAIGVLVFASLLIPVVDDATAISDKLYNVGYARYTSIDSTDDQEINISWDYTNPKFINVNDTLIDVSAYSGMWASIVFGEQFTLRYNYSPTNTQLQYFGQTNADFVYAYESSELNLTVSLNNGVITVSNGTLTKTATYDTAYYPDINGSMIMKKSNADCYLLKDSSVVIANGVTYTNPYTVGVYFNGTVNDGFDFELFRNLDDFTISNIQINYTDNSSYVGVINLSNVTFDLTPGENPAYNATYSYFLVPYEITAEKAIHADEPTREVLAVLPLILICALIMGIVGYAVYSRIE